MPPRFRRAEPMTTFELVPDDEREDGPDDAPDDPEPGAARRRLAALRGRAVTRWRALSRRGRVVVAAGTAVVVLAAATAVAAPGLLDARAERLRAEAVQALPGAVGDLSEPLTETWQLTNGNGSLATLRGGLVLTTEGTAVSALDAGTGRETWRHDVGTFPTCGPQRGYQTDPVPPAAVVVCVSGDPDDRTVTVLDTAGTVVGERSIGPARIDTFGDGGPDGAPVVVPAAAGAVAVVDGITDATAPWPADDLPGADTLRELRADGWTDPTLRVEDALTGEVRGEATVRLRPEDLGECGMVQDEGTAAELMTEPQVDASPSMTVLSVCGGAVRLTPDGTVLDAGADGQWAMPLPGGRHVVPGQDESTVLDGDGTVVATVPGWSVPPTVDDAPGSSYLALTGVGEGPSALRLASFAPDGAERWVATVDDLGGVLARVSGVVVVQDADGFVGLDARTGDEVWARDDLLQVSGYGSGDWVAGAVTDGTRLLVGIGGDGEHHRLVALDLRDGTTAWERRKQAGFLEWLMAIDGHVVAFDGVVHGLG
ncbi:PQQ-binding-like beta-propeller repeat protein [Isoptericola nanjingensis]|uniref:outer membrane protein assembly factor BamB family protein n=1 Tax=Isoptericola TaxID=254250 RepID=UPI003D1D88B8|nr:PQQ-binding-like beta-propeller repeat protein [Isoptericola sp. QY 916]